MQLNHEVCSNERHLFTLSIPLFILSLQLTLGLWMKWKNSPAVINTGQNRRETCGIALTSAVSSCSWSLMLWGAECLQYPFNSSKKEKEFQSIPHFPGVVRHPRLLSRGWATWLLQVTSPSMPSVRLTQIFLGSSFSGVTGDFHQLDPGAATHCMSLHLTHWLLIAQVQAFRACAEETERAIPQALHQLLPWADKNSTFVNWPKALPWLSSKLCR